MRPRLIDKLLPLRAVAQLDTDGQHLLTSPEPTGSHVADGDRFVVLARLRGQFRDLRGTGPCLAEIVGSQEIQAGVMITDSEVFLNRHHDRWLACVPVAWQCRNAGMKPT